MRKIKSVNRIKAFEIYKEHNGDIKPKDISMILNEKVTNIRTWKSLDRWDIELGIKKKPKGAPKGNRNALGNKGGKGGKLENQNARKHGLYSKYMPKEVYNIFSNIEDMDNIEILEDSIRLKYSNILNIQKKIKSCRNEKSLASLIKAESLATDSLRSMIKQYEDIVQKEDKYIKQERQLKLDKLKEEIRYISNKANLLQGQKKDTSLLESMIELWKEN